MTKSTAVTEHRLRAADLSYRQSRITEEGECDRFTLGEDLVVEVHLLPASDGSMSFERLALCDDTGQLLTVTGEAGGALSSEAVEVILWEKIEADDVVIDYATGRAAEKGAPGEVFSRQIERDDEPEFA